MYLAFGLAFVLTILVAFGMLSFITPKLEKEEKLKEQIIRYDESWLASNINEALYKSVLTPELLTYIVDDIKIKSVENTEDSLYIKVLAHLPYSTIPFQTFCSQKIGDRQIMPKAVVRSEH